MGYIETVAIAYNTQAHATTTLTPFYMAVSRPIPPLGRAPFNPRWVATLRSCECAGPRG